MLVTTGALYDKKAPHHIEDAKTIYDYFINNYSNQKVVDKNKSFKTIKAKYTNNDTLKLYPSKDIIIYLENDYNKNDIKYVYQGKDEITPFDKKGDTLGTLKIYYNDKLLDTQNITLKENLNFNISNFIKQETIPVVAIISTILLVVIIILKKKKLKAS